MKMTYKWRRFQNFALPLQLRSFLLMFTQLINWILMRVSHTCWIISRMISYSWKISRMISSPENNNRVVKFKQPLLKTDIRESIPRLKFDILIFIIDTKIGVFKDLSRSGSIFSIVEHLSKKIEISSEIFIFFYKDLFSQMLDNRKHATSKVYKCWNLNLSRLKHIFYCRAFEQKNRNLIRAFYLFL